MFNLKVRMSEGQSGECIFETGSKRFCVDVNKVSSLVGHSVEIEDLGRLPDDTAKKSIPWYLCFFIPLVWLVERSLRILNKLQLMGCVKEVQGRKVVFLNPRAIIGTLKKNDTTVRKRIIETLAHEARHIAQPHKSEKKPPFTVAQKLHIISIIGFSFLQWVGAICNIAFGFPPISALMGLHSLWIVLTMLAFPHFYYFRSDERDARKYAAEAAKNPQWLEAIQVQNK